MTVRTAIATPYQVGWANVGVGALVGLALAVVLRNSDSLGIAGYEALVCVGVAVGATAETVPRLRLMGAHGVTTLVGAMVGLGMVVAALFAVFGGNYDRIGVGAALGAGIGALIDRHRLQAATGTDGP